MRKRSQRHHRSSAALSVRSVVRPRLRGVHTENKVDDMGGTAERGRREGWKTKEDGVDKRRAIKRGGQQRDGRVCSTRRRTGEWIDGRSQIEHSHILSSFATLRWSAKPRVKSTRSGLKNTHPATEESTHLSNLHIFICEISLCPILALLDSLAASRDRIAGPPRRLAGCARPGAGRDAARGDRASHRSAFGRTGFLWPVRGP